jgi:hypothetical protein
MELLWQDCMHLPCPKSMHQVQRQLPLADTAALLGSRTLLNSSGLKYVLECLQGKSTDVCVPVSKLPDAVLEADKILQKYPKITGNVSI